MAGRCPAALVALLLGWLVPSLAVAQTFPPLSGRVVDTADVIPADAEARITDKLAMLERMRGRQLIVATFPDMQGYDQANFGPRLRKAWGIGGPDHPDSAVVIVAVKERKLRIELSRSLDPILTDEVTSLVMDRIMVPRFKDDDMAGGIEFGVNVLMAHMLRPSETGPETTPLPPPVAEIPKLPEPPEVPTPAATTAAVAAPSLGFDIDEDLYPYIGLGVGLLIVLLFVGISRARENRLSGAAADWQSGTRGSLDGSGLGKK